MPQPPRQDGWKHGGTSGPRKDAPGPSRKAWQPGGATGPKPTGKKVSRLGRFLVAGGIVGLLMAALAYFLLIPNPPKYAAIVLVAPDTDKLTLPENAAGVNGANEIAEWCRAGGSRPKLLAGPADSSDWAGKLDGNAKATVLYFAAHAGADDKGPYLWLPTGDKLPVREILTRLTERVPSQPKLLVFDVARTPPNWVHGGAFADFARALKDMEGEIAKDPGLAVVVSNDAGQVSWVAEERGRSIFADRFLEAIRGDGHASGQIVTAASAFAVVKQEVSKWAVANREANQTPILLPEADGVTRAGKIELAGVPPEGHQQPAASSQPATSKPLADEWADAEKLAARNPAPDATHPQQWREYLEWLLRWERLVRLNVDPGQIPNRVAAIRREITQTDGAEPAAAAVALPAGRLFGITADANDIAFDRLWTPQAPESHSTEWERLLQANSKRAPALRAALARFVLKRVLDDGPTPVVLATAENVLAAAEGSGLLPVELHFIRMLRLHLDEKRPGVELLRTALRTRQEAEAAAWADDPAARGYAEQVYRWTRPQIEKADKDRQDAEDLLFDVKQASWDQATKLFQQAADGYSAARTRGRTVAVALANRDRAFGRLPFYARWLAGYRGPMQPDTVEKLVSDVERAAKYAHLADTTLRNPPTDPTESEAKLRELGTSPDAGALAAVELAHREEVGKLSNQAQESNWHALDGSLSVPFMAGEVRAKLIGYVEQVGFRLSTNTQQQSGAKANDPDTKLVARRHLRLAGLYLGEPADRFFDGGNDTAWWKPVRASADEISQRFRKLPEQAAASADRVVRGSKPLAESTPELADAARFARLSDVAAPVTVDPRPPLAERLYWRHEFLLRQAGRTIADGWCVTDAAESDPDRWYCRKAAETLIAAAEADVRKLDISPKLLPPAEARLFALCKASRDRKPTVLTVTVPPQLDVVQDDPGIPFAYTLGFTGDRIGFPVAELKPPTNLRNANGDRLGRAVEARLRERPNASTSVTLNPGNRNEKADGPLVTAVLYRGRKYEMKTPINFSGPPNLEWIHTPPTGDAVMALIADPKAIAGAVTILIDRSYSMVDPKENPRGQDNRLVKALKGVELLLKSMPDGTTVSVGTFVGVGKRREVIPVSKPFRLNSTGDERDREMKKILEIRAQEENSNTPIAGGIKDALDPAVGGDLWPTNYTGARTLIVLTDGKDNWESEYGKPDDVVRGVLKKMTDVNVHLVLFSMDAVEQREAIGQFESLEKPDADRDPGVTFTLWPNIKDGGEFASALQSAVMPRVRYAGGRTSGILEASSAALQEYKASKAVPADSYTLTGAKGLPKVQLDPGDRVLLKAGAADTGVRLTIPPMAYEQASGRRQFPHTMAERQGNKVFFTLPELTVTKATEWVHLNMVATLESELAAADPKLLRVARPVIAWFDVTNPDGSTPDPTKLRMKVENRTGSNALVAPAWNLTLTNWDTNNPNGTVRQPVVSGYWVDSLPPALGTPKLNLRNLEQSVADVQKAKTFASNGGNAELQNAAVTEVNGKKYLTVWFSTGKPGEQVFARTTGWGEETTRPVEERHAFYDPQARYTAKFGPLTPGQAEAVVTLELYSVAALRDRAKQTGRGVSHSFAGGKLDSYSLPPTLLLNPKK